MSASENLIFALGFQLEVTGSIFHICRRLSEASSWPFFLKFPNKMDASVDSLQALFDAGQIDSLLANGTTLLYEACIFCREDLALALIELKADVNEANEDGSVPLHACIIARNVQLASLLIQNGALLDRCNNDGASPAFLAAEIGDVGLCQFLLEAEKYAKIDLPNPKSGATLLYAACLGGHHDVVKFLLGKKASTSLALWDSGNSPLHAAAFRCSAQICKLLLIYGANVNAMSHNDFSPLHVAVLKCSAEVVNLLLNSGADRNAKAANGILPIDCTSDAALKELLRGNEEAELQSTVSAPVFGVIIPRSFAAAPITRPRQRVQRDRIISTPWLIRGK